MQQYITMGAKGAGNPVGFMGSFSVSHLASIYILTGVQRVQQKKISQNNIKWHYQ